MWTSVFPETRREKLILVDLVNTLTASGQSRAKGPFTNKNEDLPEVRPNEHSDLGRLFYAAKENSIPSISVTTGKAANGYSHVGDIMMLVTCSW